MGHDHDHPRALTPAELARAAGAARPRAFAARALTAALLVAAVGAAEMTWRIHAELDPSIARRALGLYAHAAFFYWVAGALAAPLVVPACRALTAALPGRAVPSRRRLAGGACLVLAAAAFAAALAREREPRPAGSGRVAAAPGTPNLILIVVDTLRADALGAYGAPAATPHLDALAERGVLFEEVVAPSPWTLPSMASLFSGTYPARHGFTDFDGRLEPELAPGHLAEALSAAGFECRAVVGNTLLAAERGFARGFSLYDAYDFALEGRLWLWRALNRVLRATGVSSSPKRSLIPVLRPHFPFVETRLTFYNLDEDLTERVWRYALPPPREPLFLFVHYLAPHTPYLEHPFTLTKRAPEPKAVHLEQNKRLYTGEVAYTDGEIGRLLAGLERAGVLEQAVVCVTADHGEAFSEHGRFEHGYDLHREALRVPWLLAGPGIPAGLRFADPVSLVDLAPTLLAALGVSAPAGFEGRSLLGAVRGEAAAPAPVFAETSSRFLTPGARHTGAFAGSLRLLRVLDAAGQVTSEQLFDVSSDPGERAPLAGHPGLAELGPALGDYAQRAPAQALPGAELDARRMQALGYAGSDEDERAAASAASPP
jgi:arylsulfatase A-like enzyme